MLLINVVFPSFKKLREKIAKFANEPKNLQPLAKVEVGGVCLLAAFENPNDYRRGKIMEVDEDEATGDIFLVDYGVEEYRVPLSSLIEIPEKFISDLPFQVSLYFLFSSWSYQYSMHITII